MEFLLRTRCVVLWSMLLGTANSQALNEVLTTGGHDMHGGVVSGLNFPHSGG